MRNWIKHHPIQVSLIALPLVLWIGNSLHENSGVCFSEIKVLSDKALMEHALQDKFDHGELQLGSKDVSVSAYLVNHPDCCYVYRKRGIFNLYGLLIGKRSVYVRYPLSEKAVTNGRGAGGTHFEQEIDMSPCGEMRHVENLGGFTPK